MNLRREFFIDCCDSLLLRVKDGQTLWDSIDDFESIANNIGWIFARDFPEFRDRLPLLEFSHKPAPEEIGKPRKGKFAIRWLRSLETGKPEYLATSRKYERGPFSKPGMEFDSLANDLRLAFEGWKQWAKLYANCDLQKDKQLFLRKLIAELIARIQTTSEPNWEEVVAEFEPTIKQLSISATPIEHDGPGLIAITEDIGVRGGEFYVSKSVCVWLYDPIFESGSSTLIRGYRQKSSVVNGKPIDLWSQDFDNSTSAKQKTIGVLQSWVRWLDERVSNGDASQTAPAQPLRGNSMIEPRVIDLMNCLARCDDPDIGLPIFELPEELKDSVLLGGCVAKKYAEVIRRNHHHIGGEKNRRLVLEPGWSVADLSLQNRKRGVTLIQEALSEKVENEIRHRIRITHVGESLLMDNRRVELPVTTTSLPKSKTNSKRSGRKRVMKLSQQEKRVSGAWKTGAYATYYDCDQALSVDHGTTKSIIDRLRKRKPNQRQAF